MKKRPRKKYLKANRVKRSWPCNSYRVGNPGEILISEGTKWIWTPAVRQDEHLLLAPLEGRPCSGFLQ